MAEPPVRRGELLFFAADRTGLRDGCRQELTRLSRPGTTCRLPDPNSQSGPRARGGGQDGATPRTAKRHGQSTEEEARGILRGALKQEDVPGQWTGN